MKKLNKINTVAILCMIAALLFTANVFAQKGQNPHPDATCAYVPVGTGNKTVTCGTSTTLGATTTCPTGWFAPCGNPACFTINAYSWSPSTDLSSTTIKNPVLTAGCEVTHTVTYTLTITEKSQQYFGIGYSFFNHKFCHYLRFLNRDSELNFCV